ncbi:alpha/beta hydrolase [Albimonas sp. CAU 1670]|uniref:alpha/beta fold hydrolase n=1 Tax=Albimonas sp. CAU 1670 TaxID=3032599 RepID=UPI0023D9FE6C|nr:alpha/beta hydrolase [Albimonas sp. CAU 1670]MDF2234238.1 alpha/beta hydrolase [Albimonas sp. CAU 1670]
MRRETVQVRGLTFSCLVDGPEDGPLVLMLHGFPEYSGAWEEMIARLSDRYFCVAPDQRGYNLTDKPAETSDYATGKIGADALAMIEAWRPGGKAHALVGHDWGAGAAYNAAIRGPEKIERLAIINGVHPLPFQRELLKDGPQRAASQYIRFLRQPDSHEKLAADDFAGVLRMLDKKMDMAWLTPEKAAAYKRAWGQPGAMKAMVDWYRATPLVVPEVGEAADDTLLASLDPQTMRIRMPHLLIWGMEDGALLPESREGLADLCDDLEVVEIEGADHWVIHQKPDEVAGLLRRFLD